MGKVLRINPAGGREPDLLAVSQQVEELVRVVDGQVEFGEPNNPEDPGFADPATLAGAMGAAGAHNGLALNIAGSWVEIALENTGLTVATCTHNLYLNNNQYTVPVTGEPNCRWLVFGVMHDGTGKDSTYTIGDPVVTSRIGVDVAFLGDTVAANAIDLRFNLRVDGGTITVGESNPVKVSLFFTKASRGE